jgi:hypothetical protein
MLMRTTKTSVSSVLLAAAVVGGGAWTVAAQDNRPVDRARFDRTLDQIRRETRLLASPEIPPERRALVDYGALFTVSYLSTDDTELTNRAVRQYDLTGFARVNLDGAQELYIRGIASYQDYNSGDSFNDEGDHMEGFLEEAYYRLDLRRLMQSSLGEEFDNNLVLTAGRQYTQWASGLVLAQTVDGVRTEIEVGQARFDLLAGVTPFGTTDFDSSRPNFDDKTYRGFFGGMAGLNLGQHNPYVYVMVQRDYNPDDSLNFGIIETEFEYNSVYLGAGSDGFLSDKISYSVEGVFQGGDALSNSFNQDFEPIRQTEEDIKAAAAQLSLTYTPGDRYRSRWTAGAAVASGDPDRGDSTSTFNGNRSGTSDLGYNGLGAVDTGLAFAPQFSNLMVFRTGVSFFPFYDQANMRGFQMGSAVYLLSKLRSNAPIDEVTTDERFLGVEPDVFINWQVLEDVTFTFRYGIFIPGDGVVADGKMRQFLYAGLTYAF